MTIIAKLALVVVCLQAADVSSCRGPRAEPSSPEILWDTYGVPHIVAADEEAESYAFGWAQMESHGNLILRLYGRARGRAAEYWGPRELQSDSVVWALGIPDAAAQAYAGQDAISRGRIDRFVEGLNAYAAAHPEAIAPENRAVLPVQPADPFAHLQYVLDAGFIGRRMLSNEKIAIPVGSNAIALAPKRTTRGHALLVTNPHLPWTGLYTFYEAHFKLRGEDVYGATLVGLPVLVMAFNQALGWAHTKNEVDGADLYEVELRDDGTYLFDGQPTPIETRTRRVLVKGAADGAAPQERTLTVSSTRHGPILWRNGRKAVAYRSTRALYPGLFTQYWAMARATDIDAFMRALEMMQLPLFNIVYADRAGHILYRWNGLLPERAIGNTAYWARPVPGDRSETLWTGMVPFARLPQILDPSSGWVQNTNDLPWYATLPSGLQPKDYPPLVTSEEALELRSQQTLKWLQAAPRQSFETLRDAKFSNRVELADRVLDDLLRAIDTVSYTGEHQELVRPAADVLRAWNRATDADSRGAVLFTVWATAMSGSLFAQPYSPDRLLTSPSGLGQPEQAVKTLAASAARVIARHGALDVKWGDVYRLKRGRVDEPANGGPDWLGIFHTVEYGEAPAGRFQAKAGDSYSAIVEFSDPVRADVLLTYGNSSEEDSPHNGDQLTLLSQKRMRRALLSARDIQAQLARRERLTRTVSTQ